MPNWNLLILLALMLGYVIYVLFLWRPKVAPAAKTENTTPAGSVDLGETSEVFTPVESYPVIRLHLGDQYVRVDEALEMPLGQSRIGGPVIDVPEGFEFPDDMFFVAQLDLAWVSSFDRSGVLPKEGFLFFFFGGSRNSMHVHYHPGAARQLRRIVKEPQDEDWFEVGIALEDCAAEEEFWRDRFSGDEDDEEEIRDWDYFAGMEATKIGGYPCNPQWGEDEVVEALESGKRKLLLQVGEDVTGEGTLCYFIRTDELAQRRFESCQAVWGQT